MIVQIRVQRKRTNWSIGHSGSRRCISCQGLADTKPLHGCPEPRHAARHKNRMALNNIYRKARRATARAAGTVYRTTTPQAKKASDKRAYHKRKQSILAALGNACIRCGFSDYRTLQVHHKSGGGAKQRSEQGWSYHQKMAKMPAEKLREIFDLLCANCHSIEHSGYAP